ncbi:unnamed protein product [Fraxinus pennsylvanica]|uniref:Uncharacterized protein n=1 Tax=Fraxinus pennsylvanica TaxID=56036 RepID=A0AAD2DQ56_9LAMI|nr:unnamed protein product [Fraxinus pennsylvanica]
MGFLSNPLNPFTFHRTCCLSRKLQSSSCYSSSGIWVSINEFHSGNSNRKILTFRMGRRSCKIAGRKTAQDAKKTKLYSKIGKEVVSAVKKGGVSPVSNTALAALFEKAKELDVPKEIIDCNIKRASEKGQEASIEKVYEVYGCGGVGIIVKVLTDKINRSVAAVREISDSFCCFGCWCVDVIELLVDEDDPEEEMNERCFQNRITFEPDNGFELLPLTAIEVDDEAMDLNKELMSKLLELDDVDAVYSDQK